MLNLPKYLISQGWQCFQIRNTFGKPSRPRYLKSDYSEKDYLDYHFLKDDNTVVWGIGKYGNPMTLVSPRPFQTDDQVNRWLQNTPIEEVYKFILNR